MTNLEIAKLALRAAYRLRKERRRTKDEPVSAFDMAVESGLQLFFMDAPSLEGMYCDEKKAIVLSCLRPFGRRAFTCGHEIGHWIFGHGTRVDQLPEGDAARKEIEGTPEERLANMFSSFLLMPPLGVEATVKSKGWSFQGLSPEQAFMLSTFFGVAYTALLGHLRYTLKRITDSQYRALKGISPKSIRNGLSHGVECPNLVVVDREWGNRPVDVEVGDALSIPTSAVVTHLRLSEAGPSALPDHRIAVAEEYGEGELTLGTSGPGHRLRVSKRDWAGLAEHRYEH